MPDLGFDFAWPLVLYGLIGVAVLAWAMHRGQRERAAADARYGGSPDLRVGRSPVLRALRAGLFLLAITLLIIGVASPRWGAEAAQIEQRGIDVAIAVDVSRSMEAPDILPSRAEAVAGGLQNMLTHMHGNRVGLTIFGESGFERAPLTLDVDAVASLIMRAQGESALVRPGTSLAVGIDAALDILDTHDTAPAQVIVIASDGEDLSNIPLEPALERARERGIPVYALFAGTDRPTPLPDFRGHEDVTTADRSTMELIAATTGGQVREPDNVPGLAVDFRRMRQTAFETGVDSARTERFAWFIGAALALLVVQAMIPETLGQRRARPRRGAVRARTIGVAGGLLLIVGCSGTAVWQHVDAGNRAYLDREYDQAAALYGEAAELDEDGAFATQIGYNAGNALHQLDRHIEAVEASRAALEANTESNLIPWVRYALGNHYFRLGDLERARDSYVATLRTDPGDRDAKANLELVLRELAPPEAPEEGMPGDEGEPGPGEGEGAGENGNGEGDPQEGENGPPDGMDADPLMPNGGGNGGGDLPETYEEVLERLQATLGELGEEITAEEALTLLELHRRLNELDRLPQDRSFDGPPPR